MFETMPKPLANAHSLFTPSQDLAVPSNLADLQHNLPAHPLSLGAGLSSPDTTAVAKPQRLTGDALQMSRMHPYLGAMEHTTTAMAPRFEKLGIHLTPEIMMAIAMQESGNKDDPSKAKSFDNGLGIMQITPSKGGKIDQDVADVLGWNNRKSKAYNNQHSNWRDPQTNMDAGGLVLAKKAEAIRRMQPKLWESMSEEQRLRATMFAYNAGEGTAVKQLKRGGADATFTSRYKGPDGKWHSHDYSAEIKGRLDYVNGHSPFAHPATPAGETLEAGAVGSMGGVASLDSTEAGADASAQLGAGGVAAAVPEIHNDPGPIAATDTHADMWVG